MSTRISRVMSGVAAVAMCSAGLVVSATTPVAAAGQLSLTALGVPVTQNFDGLANVGTSTITPVGWDFAEAGTSSANNGTYSTGTGSNNAGDTYSFGPVGNTDRAFGGLLSGTFTPTIGASFTNDTGSTITDLDIAYTGEMWRLGTAGRADRLDFQYSTDATTLTVGTFVDVDALDFSSPVTAGTVGALDGNAVANRTAISSTISGLSIPNGATFWFRWTDFNATGADDGLAIDDFSLTPRGAVVGDLAPTVASTLPVNGATGFALAGDLGVTFSEAVDLASGAFALSCTTAGAITLGVSGGPITFVLDPAVDLLPADTCTLTVTAASVTDQDLVDPPDAMVADVAVTFATVAPDAAPEVASTVPVNGATNVARSQNVSVTFSEPVVVTDPWFSIVCSTSGALPAVVTGGPTTYTLNPTSDFVYGESCTLTIDASKVSDVDGNDPPDTMTLDFTVGFAVQADPCVAPYTSASVIQGSGEVSPLVGTAVTTRGVVVGDYEYPGSGSTAAFLRGFYLQDSGDGDPATSDAVFVFNGNNNAVNLGDLVSVTGNVGESFGQTQVSAASIVVCGTGVPAPAPTEVTFPLASATALEAVEGMLVSLPQTMSVTEHFQLGRFGQVTLSQGGRLQQPTNVVAPGASATALQASNNLRRIILDDASQGQNPDPILFGRNGMPLSASNTLRGGDTATGIVGVMTFTWAGNSASGNAYRVRPFNALGGSVNFVAANARPVTAPEVGGDVQVVGMNLLNYFNTFTGCTIGAAGPATDCRGANNATEFARQNAKTVASIVALDPHVLGVNEIENDGYGPTSAIAFLVDELNAATAAGTYAFIDADAATAQVNALGTDAIKVGMIYQPGVVTPTGDTAALDSVEFVNGGDPAPRSRPALAQAFAVNSTGGVFVVVTNHLKSKGSACGAPNAGDGQGNCNLVRLNAVNALVEWLDTDPTGTGDPDVLLIGDYNAYAKEDPIVALENAGFTNLLASFLGPDAYSYVFDGQWGYLDHALSSASLTPQVTGVADHHINADEPSTLDYNTDFKTPNLIATLFAPDQYRVSDHDPVIIGLRPNAAPTVTAGPFTVAEGGSVVLGATGVDPNGDTLTYAWDLDDDGTYETAGPTPTFSAAGIDGPATRTIGVQVTDPLGAVATASATVTITNVAPTVSAAFALARVECGVGNAMLGVTFTDPAPADTHSVAIDWGDGSSTQLVSPATSPLSVPHTYGAAGVYEATVTVTDDDGGATSTTATVAVDFTTDGFLPPLRADGSREFQRRSTIPAKVVFTDCDGAVPTDLGPTISVTRVGAATASITGTMRFSDGQWIFNIGTARLAAGSYEIVVTVPGNGQTVTTGFVLRP